MAELKDGQTYAGRPLLIEMTESPKQKKAQLSFGVAVIDEEGVEHQLVKNGGLEGEGLQYTVQDAENMGADTSLPIEEWTADPNKKLRCRIEIDPQYGPQLKSIFDAEKEIPAEAIIKKNKMSDSKKKEVSALLSDKIKALRVAKGGSDVPF